MRNKTGNLIDRSARGIAVQIVYQVLEKGAYTNIILEKYLRDTNLKREDIHLVTELANGTIRMLKHLDWVLALFLDRKIDKLNPWLKNILRISAYQILFMDKVPDHAAVNEAVNLTRAKIGVNLSRVCNGVLRNMIRGKTSISYPPLENIVSYLSVYYSQPEWLVDKLVNVYGKDTARNILIYYNERPEIILRNNELKGSRNDLIQELEKAGITAGGDERLPCAVRISTAGESPLNTELFPTGRFYIQNTASMLAAYILDPAPGDSVLDLCCGLGGKSTHLAERMQNHGQVYACDIFQHKLNLLKDNADRLGLTIVKPVHTDILKIDEQFAARSFGKILLDVPCSGLGVLNRRADLRWMQAPEKIAEIITLQKLMLRKAAGLLKSGGVLLYSTCTINPDENETVIDDFLEQTPGFELAGYDEKIDFFKSSAEDNEKAAQGQLTILPGQYDSDGMFYAKIRRIN